MPILNTERPNPDIGAESRTWGSVVALIGTAASNALQIPVSSREGKVRQPYRAQSLCAFGHVHDFGMKSKIMDVTDSKSLERDAAENRIPLFLIPLYEDTATHRIFCAL